MKKKFSRMIFCIILSVVVSISMMPLMAYAAADVPVENAQVSTIEDKANASDNPTNAGKKVKIKYNTAKGKLSSKSKKSKTVTVGKKYGKLASVSRSGYKFKGWYYGGKKITKNTIVTKASAHKLKAKWLKKGTGKSVTASEYKNIKKGMSYSDVKTVIGGKALYGPTTLNFNGKTYIGYEWIYGNNTKNSVVALFLDGKLVWKAKGNEDKLTKEVKKFFGV